MHFLCKFFFTFLKGAVSDKGYNSMSREELKSLTHQPSSGETDSEQQKAHKEKTSLRFTLPITHKSKEKKEVNGEQTALYIVQQQVWYRDKGWQNLIYLKDFIRLLQWYVLIFFVPFSNSFN